MYICIYSSLCEKYDEYQIDTVTHVARASDSHAHFAVALNVLVNTESMYDKLSEFEKLLINV